ncbi:MAG: serine hydrolase [Alphaproteobacteria bacterium]|nr:serine hydrolase [Alphaproteobacteria bacterium]
MSPATRNRGQDMRLRTRIHDALISFMRGSPHLGVAIGAWPESAVSVDDAWVFAEGTTCWPHVSLPDRRTVWQIGSVTKTFTATMLAATVRDGRIDLVDNCREIRANRRPPALLHQLARINCNTVSGFGDAYSRVAD